MSSRRLSLFSLVTGPVRSNPAPRLHLSLPPLEGPPATRPYVCSGRTDQSPAGPRSGRGRFPAAAKRNRRRSVTKFRGLHPARPTYHLVRRRCEQVCWEVPALVLHFLRRTRVSRPSRVPYLQHACGCLSAGQRRTSGPAGGCRTQERIVDSPRCGHPPSRCAASRCSARCEPSDSL